MGANIDGISLQMAQQAANLDQQAAQLKADAAQRLIDGKTEAEDFLAKAKRLAEEMIANAQRQYEEKLAAAQQEAERIRGHAKAAEDDAKHWRSMSVDQRKKARLEPLPNPLPPSPNQTQRDGQPTTWTGPGGRVWDLTIHYIDSTGATWHWANDFELVDGVPWPLMSRDDFGARDVPLVRCPAFNPAPPAPADAPGANGDTPTAAMPVVANGAAQ